MAKKIRSSLAGVTTDAIPESPILRRQVPPEAPSRLTVNGAPIPPELLSAIPYANTDQGLAERLAKPTAHATVTRDALSKRIEERADFRRESLEPWEAPDPMKDLADKHVKPGMRARFLSPEKVRRDGARGFEPVIDAGDPVKLGEMILAQMPEERAVARNHYYQSLGTEQMSRVEQEFKEGQQRLARDAGFRGRAVEDADTGVHSVRGNEEEILR